MCKINGHSIFTYTTQPWKAQQLYTSNKRASEVSQAQKNAAETLAQNTDGDENATTATTAKIRNPKKNQTLSSLRVPTETAIGASLGGNTSLGLNLGG